MTLLGLIVSSELALRHFSQTFGSTDMPTRKW